MAEALPVGWNSGLRKERERRGWTRAELAEKIKAGTHSIYRWEEKGDKPHADVLQALIHLFGKPVEAWGKSIWRMPYLPNVYFTGRERVLTYLHTRLGGLALREPERLPVALSQTRAISGLGGIGKTQTAVEYAYRFRGEYDMVVLVHASEREVLVAELAALAPLLGLPTYAETNQERLAQAVKRWLETQKEQVWLLIFDNVDDVLLVKEFLPEKGNGAVLLTTRLQAVGKYMHKIELGTLTQEEGFQFFQRRVGTGEVPERKVLSEDERQAAAQLYTLLGGLPLALEQAAAYIEEYGCSLAAYVDLYQQQRATFLQMQNPVDRDYPDSVATTWLLSFQRVEQANPDAVNLLHLLAFLHPDSIPEEALLQGAAELGTSFQVPAENAARLQAAIEILQKYSLIQYHQTARTLTIHRLVQAVIQDRLDEARARQWAERAVLVVNAAFPSPGDQSDWSQCEQLLPHALLAAHYIEEQDITSEEAGRLVYETASYLQDRARFSEAEPLFQRALQMREERLGPEHLDVAASLNGLADLYREQGKHAEAEPLFQRALRIREEYLGPDHILVAISLANVANLYRDQGKHSEAESLYQRARHIFEQYIEPDHPQISLSQRNLAIRYGRLLSNLAAMYLEHGKYGEAEPLFRHALHTFEQVVGSEHLDLAPPLSNLAILYKEQGRYAEAEPLYLRSQHIWGQVLGPEHPQLALAFNNLAELYKDQGRYAEAEPLYQNARRLWEQHLGAGHLLVAIALNNLADIFREQGRFTEAEPLYERALRLFEQGAGPAYYLLAYALNGRANLAREQSRHAEAEPLYLHALDIRKQTWGFEHPETAETIHDLARLREAQGNREEARSGYERALSVRTQTLGEQHPKTVETRQRLSALLHTLERSDEAAR